MTPDSSPLLYDLLQGFDEDLQQEGTLLGTFAYDQDGDPIQTFYFQVQDCELMGWNLNPHPHPINSSHLPVLALPGTGLRDLFPSCLSSGYRAEIDSPVNDRDDSIKGFLNRGSAEVSFTKGL